MLGRVELEARLGELGIEPAESQANFAWFALPVAEGEDPAEREAEVVRGLAKRGVLVRTGGALGRTGWLRVAYGRPEHNARFLAALGELVERG